MLLVGLTGNIGMGKSTVLGLFAGLGAAAVKTDDIVAELLTFKQVLDQVRKVLGGGVFNGNGSINKPAVAEVIFTNEELRHAYEAVLHPLVFMRVDDYLRNSKADMAVVEVPLLFESGNEVRFNKIVTVYTDENVAIDRVSEGGVPRREVALRLACQMPIAEKVRLSHFAIDNNDGLDRTRTQTQKVYRALLASV